jgi:hypothetical protein
MPRVKWIRPPYTRGLPPEQRFWSYVEKTDGCWLWRGTRQTRTGRDRYGGFDLDGRTVRAHRYSLEVALGRPLRDGMYALHDCDNPQCVRPGHLYEGTAKQNAADRERRGRRIPRSGETHHNAKLSADDVYAIKLMAGEGWRPIDIQRQFNVSYTHIKRVVRGECRATA